MGLLRRPSPRLRALQEYPGRRLGKKKEERNVEQSGREARDKNKDAQKGYGPQGVLEISNFMSQPDTISISNHSPASNIHNGFSTHLETPGARRDSRDGSSGHPRAIEVARRLTAAGLSVIPVRTNGTKKPALDSWKKFQARIAPPEELKRMFRGGVGLAVICGKVSGGLEVLDLEAAADWESYSEFVEICAPGLLNRLVHVATPSGGRHLCYRCEAIEGGKKLAERLCADDREVLIETRGEGNYVVSVGSPPACHRANKPYRLVHGDLTNIPTISPDERDILLSCARSFNEIITAKREPAPATNGTGYGERPGDDFNARASWSEILEPHGWKLVGRSGDCTLWRRPGKHDGGNSATANYCGSGLLYNFSTNAHPFENLTSYSKFFAFALLNHGGDMSAAARALKQQGYGARGSANPAPEVRDQAEEQTGTQEKGNGRQQAAPSPASYVSATPPESFVSRYVEYGRQCTDAPPEAHELMAVGLLSGLAGPSPRLPLAAGVQGMSLGLWVIYTVNSTMGRKSTVVSLAEDIALSVLGREAILYWEGSPQGFIQRLMRRDGRSAVFTRDEYSGLLTQMNRGGHMASLPQTFIRAYDGKPLENIRTRKRNKQTGQLEDDEDRVEEPHLVKLCASTWDSLVKRATIDNILDGFLARFVVFKGTAVPQRQKLATPEIEARRKALIDHARAFHQKAAALGKLEVDEEALELSWQLEQALAARAEECSQPDAAGPALKRLADSILKVAAILAIDGHTAAGVPRVMVEHFNQAAKMGARWLDSTLELIETLGRTSFRQDCDGVLSIIRANPNGIALSKLYRKRRNLKKRDLDDVLAALETQEEIDRHQPEAAPGDKGRRPAVFYPARMAS